MAHDLLALLLRSTDRSQSMFWKFLPRTNLPFITGLTFRSKAHTRTFTPMGNLKPPINPISPNHVFGEWGGGRGTWGPTQAQGEHADVIYV